MSESQHQRSPEHQPSSLDALTAALEEAAERLRAGEIEREEAAALVERCAELAAEVGAELERNILRVALFELLHRDDVPVEVAIDEAVEAAKELCGADAPGFINGILGAVHREEVASA